jgi:hypothetical protein
MKILVSTLFIFLFYSCNGQTVYEINKAELENCHTCKPKEKNAHPNPEWIETDLTRFREMVNPIADLKPSVSDFLTIYPSLLSGKGNASSKTIGLLDELKLISHDFYGGYTSFNLKILTYNDLIIYSRLDTEVEENVFENIYLKEISIPLTCSGANMEYYKLYNQNLSEYQKKYPNFTLEIDTDEYNTDALNAYYNLNQVEWNMDTYHVDDDFVHFANTFFKTLLEKKEYDIIKKLIFGINPVSRIYAYSALERAEKDGYKIDMETKKQMEIVKKSGLKFKSGILSCWIGKMDYDYYDFAIETEKK